MSAANGAESLLATIRLTRWDDFRGRSATELTRTWPDFVSDLRAVPLEPVKDQAPLVKLARFGSLKTPLGCLRHDANVDEVTGLEGDYDAGVIQPEEGVALLEEYHARAVVVTSWSHTPEAPRWRVFAPLSRPVAPAERRRLLARLNGVLGGVLAPESFTLSQSYFIGRRPGGEYRVICTYDDPDHGTCLDEIDLDYLAIDSSAPAPSTNGNGAARAEMRATGATAIPDALRQALDGHGKAGLIWREGKDGGTDRSVNDASLAGTLGALGFDDPEIEAALRAYPLGQIGQGALKGKLADRQIGKLLAIAAEARAKREAAVGGVTLDDFYAYMREHNYIFVPARETWPAASVNARIPQVRLLDPAGNPTLDEKGKPKKVNAAAWLDQHRAVEQMTWAPGEPLVIEDRLISHGGWIARPGCRTFNLYRPSLIELGDSSEAGRWLEHTHRVFGSSAEHIIQWLAHRVQRPQEKVNHALALLGDQGTGKDTTIEGAVPALGPWNVQEVSPDQLLGRFNSYIKSVVLRVSEARDLGDTDRYRLYDHLKTLTAAPPNVLRCDEKHLQEYSVPNVCGVVITSNDIDGIYLPADDRRHFVAWTDLTKESFEPGYFDGIYRWYEDGGFQHIAAYLAELDLSGFNPKTPPPKTEAFWRVVDAGRAPEDSEISDILDRLQWPSAITLRDLADHAEPGFADWLRDRRNSRNIPHRLKAAEYVAVLNDGTKDGRWKVGGKNQVIYARRALSTRDQLAAARFLAEGSR